VAARNVITIGALTAALICAVGWFHEHQALRETRQTLVSDTLDPIVEMLKENAAMDLLPLAAECS
jgi:hypothetical protein